jgi:membrane associated rhomboid family serine protease
MSVTIIIIVITAGISVLAFSNRSLFEKLKFNAYDVKHNRHWYKFFTYGLVHADFLHLAVNMIVLLSFGRIVETYFSILFPDRNIFDYLLLYVGALMISILPAYSKHKNDVFYSAVGASGAVSAVIFASIILYPTGKIMLFFIPIGIPSPIFGLLYIGYELYMSKKSNDNIGHDAHLWGAIYGVIFTLGMKPSLALRFLEQLGVRF